MRPPGIVCAAAWLTVTASLLSLTGAEPSAPDPSLNDALSSAALPPVLAANIPPVDAESWALLLERARKAVESESRKEYRADGVQVVRETFFVPLSSPNVGASDATPAVGAAVAGSNAPSKTQEQAEPANILKTVAKLRVLRPLFVYAIHHPLRFLYAYALVPLLSLLLGVVWALLSPFSFLISTLVLSPLSFALSVVGALAPLWYTLAGALACGTACGGLAGLVAGRSTRVALDETLAVTTRAGRWLGVLPKEGAAAEAKASRHQKKGGFGAGARLERFAPGSAAMTATGSGRSTRGAAPSTAYASSSTGTSASAKSRGKRRAFDSSETEDRSAYTSSSGVKREEDEEDQSDEMVSGDEEEEWDEEMEEDALAKPQTTTPATGEAGWRGRRVPY